MMSIKNKLLFALAISIFLFNSFALDQNSYEYRAQRKWTESLALHNNSGIPIEIDTNQWILETKRFISTENLNRILEKHSVNKLYENNICAGRMILFCKFDEDIKKFFQLDLETIFISGKLQIKQEFNNCIISAFNFLPKPFPRELNIIEEQTRKVNSFLNRQIVNTGTCAEASMILYIRDILPEFMKDIKEIEKNKNFEIIGTVLEISSLKDPCARNCIPMFNGFMENMRNILSDKSRDFTGINIANSLENLVLVAGQQSHLNSRKVMENVDGIIKVDFNNPKNRIYSKNN